MERKKCRRLDIYQKILRKHLARQRGTTGLVLENAGAKQRNSGRRVRIDSGAMGYNIKKAVFCIDNAFSG